MNNNHITIFVGLSDEDKLLEQELEKQRIEVNNKIDAAIKHQKPYKELRDLESKLYCSIRDLKGGVFSDRGQRMPKNSTELAQAILLKAQKVAYLEENYINDQLNDLRNKMQLMKTRIETIILFSIEHKLDEKFEDFEHIIKLWVFEKSDIFDKPERCEPAFGNHSLCMLQKNLIGYCIKKLRYFQFLLGEGNHKKTNSTQVSALISICKIVISSEDDNQIFDQLFLMGQYAANLNSIELGIKTQIDKDISMRTSSSKSDWTHELAQRLYLQYWIHNKYHSTEEILEKINTGEYKDLKKPNKVKDKDKVSYERLEKVIREKRKFYSKIDPRICLPRKGRPKLK